MKRTDCLKTPVVTINVTDIDEAVRKVEKSGGRLVIPKRKVGDMGLSACASY